MIEDFCRNIFNVGLNLSCSLPSVNCLCPEKSAYEYLCYQCYLSQKSISEEDYDLKFNVETGKVVVDHKFEKEDSCSSPDWIGYQIINVTVERVELEEFLRLSQKYEASIIELVALALTQTAIFRHKEVAYISVINAFKTEQFINHFWNLLLAIMQHMNGEKDCTSLLDELSRCIMDINTIYGQFEQVGRQFNKYLEFICLGLERRGHSLGIEQAFLSQQGELVSDKQKANTLEEFLFICRDTDGKIVEHEFKNEFIRLCTLLKKYLMSYQEQSHAIRFETYDRILSALNLFSEEKEFVANSIKGLEMLDLQTTNAWKANADIVLRYLQSVRKRNIVVAYSLTSE